MKYTEAGNATFNAREREHDDLVPALAIAIAVFELSAAECAIPESILNMSM